MCVHTDAHVDTCNTGMEIICLGSWVPLWQRLCNYKELGEGCVDLTYLVSMKETVFGLEDSCTPVPRPCKVGMEEGVRKRD